MMTTETMLTRGGCGDARKVWVEGEPFEIWENPDAPFEGTPAELKLYAARGRWDLVFNALVLGADSE